MRKGGNAMKHSPFLFALCFVACIAITCVSSAALVSYRVTTSNLVVGPGPGDPFGFVTIPGDPLSIGLIGGFTVSIPDTPSSGSLGKDDVHDLYFVLGNQFFTEADLNYFSGSFSDGQLNIINPPPDTDPPYTGVSPTVSVAKDGDSIDINGSSFANLGNFYAADGGAGSIYGNAFISQGSYSIPIPSAILLLGTGLIGIFGIRRKFKK